MNDIPDKSIDMVLCDLPYGTTSFGWDTIIPFDGLWEQYRRIVKDDAAICLFGIEPFTSKLILSNLEMFKYNWFWNKRSAGGYVSAKLKPMNTMETISVFSLGVTANGSKRNMKYYPQGLKPYNKIARRGNKPEKENIYFRQSTSDNQNFQEWTNYPKNYLEFPYEKQTVHPTQKPVPLLEYLIKTYTNEGEIVLDNCMGSGSTGVACLNTNRDFIGIELEEKYFNIAKQRIETHEFYTSEW
jgi:site-specific DNA-methyltransferase (adenine-specific)